MVEHHWMFYTLANVHRHIVIGKGLPPTHRLQNTFLDLLYAIRNAAIMFNIRLVQPIGQGKQHNAFHLGAPEVVPWRETSINDNSL